MLTREKTLEQVKQATNEDATSISPASLQSGLGSILQGFAALTNNYLCFVCINDTGDMAVSTYPLAEAKLGKSNFGVIGKMFEIITAAEKFQLGGMQSAFESALDSKMQKWEGANPAAPAVSAPRATANLNMKSSSPEDGGNFAAPRSYAPPVNRTPASGGGSNPLIAIVIAIVLVGALGVVGFIFFQGMNDGGKNKSAKNISSQEDSEENDSENSGSVPARKNPEFENISISNSSGNTIVSARRKESGSYAVETGGSWKVKVDEDRVKVKDDAGNTLIKVKSKDYGFKITDGNDVTIIKCKLAGSGYKIKTEDTELGRIQSSGEGFIITDAAGNQIGAATTDGTETTVADPSGTIFYKATGTSPKAAAILKFLDNRLDAQIGLLVYFNEF